MSKRTVHQVVKELSEAMIRGDLDVRGDVSGLGKQDGETVLLVNQMIDAMVAPMRLAGNALDEVAHGNLPPFVIDEYQGEYNRIKQNINTLLAILYGMHGETIHLNDSVSQGKLKTRGNDWDYQGIWKELIAGMNQTLDAVTAPINEAAEVLERLARYDLRARMRGKYRGEHAAIRKAMNATAAALNEAIAQVSETVELVSEVGQKITAVSSSVARGAEEQSLQLAETSKRLNSLSEAGSRSADRSNEALGSANLAVDTISRAKGDMAQMVASMNEIKEATESTASIAVEIDSIAKETGVLAESALEKAARMRISAGGFGVVAQEIRKLSAQCTETAKTMQEFGKNLEEGRKAEFTTLIGDLLRVARFSNLLGVNAAIEAAHVEEAGNEFKAMTDQIHNLATRAADSARSTGVLTSTSAKLTQKGAALSQEIDEQLEAAARDAQAIKTFADEILNNMHDQGAGLEEISRTATMITEVTEKNASGATESLGAAQDLEKQVDKLSKMVNRFAF